MAKKTDSTTKQIGPMTATALPNVPKKTLTKAEQKAKEERLLARRQKRETHEGNIAALQRNPDLWKAFVGLKEQIGQLNGDKKLAVTTTLRRLLTASARTRRVTQEQKEKKLARRNRLAERLAKIDAELGVSAK